MQTNRSVQNFLTGHKSELRNLDTLGPKNKWERDGNQWCTEKQRFVITVSIGGCYGFLVQLSRSKVEESDLANGVKVTRVNDANDTILMQLVTSNDNTET